MNSLDFSFQRRSVRYYRPEPVEPGKLNLLLKAAIAAPAACNSQLWEFAVVTAPETLERLRATLSTGRYNAPAAVVVCADVSVAARSGTEGHWVRDCSAAAENILLAAPTLGLGTVWIGVYPVKSVMARVTELLATPTQVVPYCAIYVGYPADNRARHML